MNDSSGYDIDTYIILEYFYKRIYTSISLYGTRTYTTIISRVFNLIIETSL